MGSRELMQYNFVYEKHTQVGGDCAYLFGIPIPYPQCIFGDLWKARSFSQTDLYDRKYIRHTNCILEIFYWKEKMAGVKIRKKGVEDRNVPHNHPFDFVTNGGFFY